MDRLEVREAMSSGVLSSLWIIIMPAIPIRDSTVAIGLCAAGLGDPLSTVMVTQGPRRLFIPEFSGY